MRRRHNILGLVIAAALAIVCAPSHAAGTAQPSLGKPLNTIYNGALKEWHSVGTAKVDLACPSPVHTGPYSIRVDLSPGTALEFADEAFDGSRYGALTFWVNGGPTGGQSGLVVRATEYGEPSAISFSLPALPANAWVQEIVPLDTLGAEDSSALTGFRIESTSADAVPTFYVDNVVLTQSTRPLPRIPLPFKQTGNPLELTGVNISGGEWVNVQNKPIKHGPFPFDKELDYFVAHGCNIIRFPFRWEVLQPELDQPWNKTEFDQLKAVVDLATSKGLIVILDPHNYDRYHDKLVGSPDVPDSAFASFWAVLATAFKDNPRVYFGLVNEPSNVSPTQWFNSAQAAVTAIRETGAKSTILVPGVFWSAGHMWLMAKSDIMINLKDPADNYMFEVHEYLDPSTGGGRPNPASATIGSDRLKAFTQWCHAHKRRAILGEFAVGQGNLSHAALDDMLGYMEANRDVWAGYTWWAAGPWPLYIYGVEPRDNGDDSPMMWYLLPHLHGMDAKIDPNKVSAYRVSTVPATAWKVIGPFGGAQGTTDIDTVFPPERGVDLEKGYAGYLGKQVSWTQLGDTSEWVDLGKLTGLTGCGVNYAYARIRLDSPQTLWMQLSVDYYAKAWVNGELVQTIRDGHDKTAPIGFPAKLKAGWNDVLVKVQSGSQGNGFSLSLRQPQGGVEWGS